MVGFLDQLLVKETPDRIIGKESLGEWLYSRLSNLSLEEFVELMVNDVDAVESYIRLLHGDNFGQKISLLFNPHRLDTRTKGSKKSIFEGLKNPSFIEGLARAILVKIRTGRGIQNGVLYTAMELNVNGHTFLNEFHPYLARDLLQRYHVGAEARVLDPCAGWGGRMIGASVVVNYYHGFEPSTRTYKGLCRLSEWIKQFSPDFDGYVECLPFEDSLIEPNSFDFALTSPPYYDVEIYSDEETNSLNRYRSFELWRDGFYLPMIQKTMDSLKPCSIFILNVGNRTYPLGEILVRNFGCRYRIRQVGALSGKGGLGKLGEGEILYEIRKG